MRLILGGRGVFFQKAVLNSTEITPVSIMQEGEESRLVNNAHNGSSQV